MEYSEINNRLIDQDKILSHKLKKSYLVIMKIVLKPKDFNRINTFQDQVQIKIFYPNHV